VIEESTTVSGKEFSIFARRNLSVWQECEGAVVSHQQYGIGEITQIWRKKVLEGGSIVAIPAMHIYFEMKKDFWEFEPNDFAYGPIEAINVPSSLQSRFNSWRKENEHSSQSKKNRKDGAIQSSASKQFSEHTTIRAWNNFLNQKRVKFLYHITHANNLRSILRHGLVSHNYANELPHVDISMQEVNARRAWCETVFKRPIHDYVPFYFNPKNPMLYKRRDAQRELVILGIDRAMLFNRGVLITDGNAASHDSCFYKIGGLQNIDWDCLASHYWNNFQDGKRKRCAEALIPDKVGVHSFCAIFCCNQKLLNWINSWNKTDIPVRLVPELFFN
jgi:hypothetical protein